MFEQLQVIVFVPVLLIVYVFEPEQRLSFPVILALLVNAERDTEQVFVVWATPLIYGVTDTFEGKEVPELGYKVLEVEVELICDQPL